MVLSRLGLRLGEQLRPGALPSEALLVSVPPSPLRPGPAYSNAATVDLRPATGDPFALIAAATAGARRIWRDGFAMSKAGVILTGLVPVSKVQPDLLAAADRARGARLMAAMDAINSRMGRDTLVPAATMGRAWRMRQDSRSPSYTTEMDDVPVVRA
ncbi:DUF4113 domain-containing protein [Azospirillum brasilense]|nr:DUF4113 domain-containing protein [Azospirillum brasilense]